MGTANRAILVIVLVALVVVGTFGAIYAFAGPDYELMGLPGFLAAPETAQAVRSWVDNFENGVIPVLDYVLVIAVFFVGLALLVLEVMPHRRRELRLGEHAWVGRRAVEKAAEQVALRDPAVLESRARLRLNRLLATRLLLKLVVRRGENAEEARQRVHDLVGTEIMGDIRTAVGKVDVRAIVKDPRQAKRRVK